MEPVVSVLLASQNRVSHGFYTRHDDFESVAAQMDIPLLRCQQVHSADVVVVEAPWNDADRPEADALVGGQAGVALAVVTADCAPVLFADPLAGVTGAAHAGWRGALDGVVENTVAAMEALGAERTRIVAAVGPCIGPKSYEVDTDFRHNFLQETEGNERFFVPASSEGHYMFDLPSYVNAKLVASGVGETEIMQHDTCQDEARFNSHRRAQDKGRQVSVVYIK